MVYKYTSIKTVIDKVLRDLDLQEGNIRVADMIEWAADALEKIGSFPQFIIKSTGRDSIPLLELTNYQTELPFDFHRLIQVSYSTSINGPFYPMRYGTGSFDSNPILNNNSNINTGVSNIVDTNSLVTLAMQMYNLDYAAALTLINSNVSTRELLESLLSNSSSSVTRSEYDVLDYTFVIRGGYIKTNVETGYIMLSYLAIPTDFEGYPLIPDTPSFKEALYWYINMKLTYPEWKTGKVKEAVYMDAKRSWAYYCKQAYGDAMLPDRPQLESFKNSWLRLIPNINEYDTDMAHMGQQEVVYNHAT